VTGSGPASRRARRLNRLALRAILLAGLAGVILAVQLLVLLALGRLPTDEERTVLAVSTVAAGVAALLYQPARVRLNEFARGLLPAQPDEPNEVLRELGTRLGHAVPLDELLLELAGSLRTGLRLEAVEIWTGEAGVFERITSDPDRGAATVSLGPTEDTVIARAGVCGPARLAVWLPALLDGRAQRPLRAAPITSADELLGLVVAERSPGDEPFTAVEEGVLAELARQVGFALRNARLDSQLRATLDELRRQAEQLRLSRARVVSAADAERRRIEQDLHDGAQQRLVGLGVNLRLARELSASDPAQAHALLEQLGDDVVTALEELRELAHGIYPSVLADGGLAPALAAVAARATIPTRAGDVTSARYPPQLEATVYFCCLEALQNASKHAGARAAATIRVWEDEEALLFEVADDGAGFDPAEIDAGAGLASMTDRLGAIGGRLRIDSAPGSGVRVTGTIPLSAAGRPGTAARPGRAGSRPAAR
jgi:signal transduction histidine kinase